jgi:hypothetical protein
VRDAAAVADTLDQAPSVTEEPAETDARGVRRGAFGFERRGLVPAAIVAGIVAFYAAGLPFVDALILPSGSYSSPGATAQLTPPPRDSSTGAVTPSGPSTEVQLVPASEWSRDPDSSSSRELTLERDGTTFHVRVYESDAEAEAAERRLERSVQRDHVGVVFNPRQTFVTDQGVAGVGASFVAARTEGLVFAFARSGTVVEVQVVGPVGAVHGDVADDADAMVRSVRFT